MKKKDTWRENTDKIRTYIGSEETYEEQRQKQRMKTNKKEIHIEWRYIWKKDIKRERIYIE